MINILKEGKLPTKIQYVFKEKCRKCGCEFEFAMEDCEYVKYDRSDIYKRYYLIICPYCKSNITGSNIFDLECREVEVEGK